MKIFNLQDDDWDRAQEREGWRSKQTRVGARIGAELIGGSLSELEPTDERGIGPPVESSRLRIGRPVE